MHNTSEYFIVQNILTRKIWDIYHKDSNFCSQCTFIINHCNTVCLTHSQRWPLPFLVWLFQSVHFWIESLGNEAEPGHFIHDSHMADVEDIDQIIRGRQQRRKLEIAHSHNYYSLFSTVLEIHSSLYCLPIRLILNGLLFTSIGYVSNKKGSV